MGLIDESIALFIFNNSSEFSKFDKDAYTAAVGGKYGNVALKILEAPAYRSVLYDSNLFLLGNNHVEAATIIIATSEFSSKLNDKQRSILKDKVMKNVLSIRMIC